MDKALYDQGHPFFPSRPLLVHSGRWEDTRLVDLRVHGPTKPFRIRYRARLIYR
jgi:hypothetical protein